MEVARGSKPKTNTKTSRTTSTNSATKVCIQISNYKFHPKVVHIKPGDSVSWECADGVVDGHQVNWDKNGSRVEKGMGYLKDSGKLLPGKRYRQVFNNAGIHRYNCPLFTFMKGQVIVDEVKSNLSRKAIVQHEDENSRTANESGSRVRSRSKHARSPLENTYDAISKRNFKTPSDKESRQPTSSPKSRKRDGKGNHQQPLSSKRIQNNALSTTTRSKLGNSQAFHSAPDHSKHTRWEAEEKMSLSGKSAASSRRSKSVAKKKKHGKKRDNSQDNNINKRPTKVGDAGWKTQPSEQRLARLCASPSSQRLMQKVDAELNNCRVSNTRYPRSNQLPSCASSDGGDSFISNLDLDAVEVDIRACKLSREEVTISVGSIVRWHVRDNHAHNLVGKGWKSKIIEHGQMFEKTFHKVGVYNYACQVYPWMQGRISVVPSMVEDGARAAERTRKATTKATLRKSSKAALPSNNRKPISSCESSTSSLQSSDDESTRLSRDAIDSEEDECELHNETRRALRARGTHIVAVTTRAVQGCRDDVASSNTRSGQAITGRRSKTDVVGSKLLTSVGKKADTSFTNHTATVASVSKSKSRDSALAKNADSARTLAKSESAAVSKAKNADSACTSKKNDSASVSKAKNASSASTSTKSESAAVSKAKNADAACTSKKNDSASVSKAKNAGSASTSTKSESAAASKAKGISTTGKSKKMKSSRSKSPNAKVNETSVQKKNDNSKALPATTSAALDKKVKRQKNETNSSSKDHTPPAKTEDLQREPSKKSDASAAKSLVQADKKISTPYGKLDTSSCQKGASNKIADSTSRKNPDNASTKNTGQYSPQSTQKAQASKQLSQGDRLRVSSTVSKHPKAILSTCSSGNTDDSTKKNYDSTCTSQAIKHVTVTVKSTTRIEKNNDKPRGNKERSDVAQHIIEDVSVSVPKRDVKSKSEKVASSGQQEVATRRKSKRKQKGSTKPSQGDQNDTTLRRSIELASSNGVLTAGNSVQPPGLPNPDSVPNFVFVPDMTTRAMYALAGFSPQSAWRFLESRTKTHEAQYGQPYRYTNGL